MDLVTLNNQIYLRKKIGNEYKQAREGYQRTTFDIANRPKVTEKKIIDFENGCNIQNRKGIQIPYDILIELFEALTIIDEFS